MEWGGKMKGRNAHGDTGNMTRRAAGHTQPPDAERNGFAAMRRGEAGSGRDQMALQPPSTHTIWPVV